MAGDVALELKALTGEFIAKMREAGNEVEHLQKKGASSLDKLASVGKAAFLGIVTSGAAVAAMSVHLADDFEKSHARLVGAITNAGGNFDEFSKRIGDTESKMEAFGHTNADVESALAPLVNATHDTSKALGEMQLAADIAAGRNISLSDATAILTKVATGHVALLGRLGINTKDATGKTIDQTEAVKRLSAMYGGDAQRTAETFAGKTEALKTRLEDVGKNIGMALIPILEQLASTVESVISWFQKHSDVALALAAVIGGALTGAIAAWTIQLIDSAAKSVGAFASWVAGFGAVDAAEATTVAESEVAGPAITAALGPIGILLAGLGVAAYELYKHWDTVWGFIKNVAGDAWHWMDSNVIQPIEGAFTDVEHFAQHLFNIWNSVWVGLAHALQWAWDHTLGPILNTIEGAIGRITHALGSLSGAFNMGAPSSTSLLQQLQNQGANIQIPGHAMGGPVAAGSLSWVGENGPELFVPGTSGAIVPNHALGGMTLNQTNNYYGTQGHPDQVAKDTAWRLRVGALAT